jgi:Fe2+ or Zn2+ uptake regulation protein
MSSLLQIICNKVGEYMREMIDRLQSQGGRLTSQRRLIFETLTSLKGHPTAEDLYAIVRQRAPNMHLSTVYRTLRWLEQEGLVSSRHFQEKRRTERFDPSHPAEHHHFVCTACQRVIEFNSPLIEDIKEEFTRHNGAKVGLASIELYGLCSDCQGIKKE